jgi:hypothetical protein
MKETNYRPHIPIYFRRLGVYELTGSYDNHPAYKLRDGVGGGSSNVYYRQTGETNNHFVNFLVI